MKQRCNTLISLVCAVAIQLTALGDVSAQSPWVLEERTGGMEADPTGIAYLKWVWRWANILSTEIDTSRFQGPLTFKEALGVAYEQCADRGIEVPILVDRAAFVEKLEDDEVYDAQMDFSALPKRVPLSRLLMEMLDQLPRADATIVVRHTYLEITTVRAAGRSGMSFHIARRIAPIVRFWSWAGLVAALAFLMVRATNIWRRPERRIFAFVVVIPCAVLVWLFWPIWLVIAGVGLLRNRNSASSSVAR